MSEVASVCTAEKISWARKRAWLAVGALAAAMALAVPTARAARRPYAHFSVAIYIPVSATRALADPATRRRQFERVWSQIHFNKVYLEVYRDGVFAKTASLPGIIRFFRKRGITVDGGLALARGGHGGGFGSFDWQDPAALAECQRAVRLAARHFNTIILDDFFFYSTRSPADIRAKGQLSWSQYRLRRMRWVAKHVVLASARAVNPRVKMIIKYPNWYEHFQGLGYDLGVEARAFSGIYTGDETRDPVDTTQTLQQYQSYLIYRYFANIRPGADLGGWVDTFGINYADRYAEQLWDTLLAKAPEITLFSWTTLASSQPARAGERAAWAGDRTSLDWRAMVRAYHAPADTPEAVPGWASVAAYALKKVDALLGRLGRPMGIASLKPLQSSGEDFLQDYLGDIGVPIDLVPHFPVHARVVLLTAQAAYDPNLVGQIEAKLRAGGQVIITSGLLRTLEREHRGIKNVAQITYEGEPMAVRHYFASFGPGSDSLDVPGAKAREVIFPQIRYFTNDAWPLVRGEAAANSVPILLTTGYAGGVLDVLNIPSNMGQLYDLPEPVLNTLREYLLARFPVRFDAPAHVSLFAYTNHTFVVESFRPNIATVRIFVPGRGRRLKDLDTGQVVSAAPLIRPSPHRAGQGVTSFVVQVAPHSYRAFAVE